MGYFIGAIVYAIIFGMITKYVAESKGYEGRFWWGFFLGIIGLLVVGFRPNNNQQSYYSYSNSESGGSVSHSQITVVDEPKATKKEEKRWICIECKTENPEKSKFCSECGEPRHYDWKCNNCGEVNEAKVKYCFNCGKAKETSEEVIPAIDEKKSVHSFSELLPQFEDCKRARDILKTIYENVDTDNLDESSRQLIEKIERKVEYERVYGSMINDTKRLIEEYINTNS